MIRWVYYPHSRKPDPLVVRVVSVFESAADSIDSKKHSLTSNQALARVADGLASLGFQVERGKRLADRVPVPVLFGMNGKPAKTFDADAYHEQEGFVVEVEAGRAVDNNQFLKDLFQACMMHALSHLGIAVRNDYRGSDNFEAVCRFFDALYASARLTLPLRGVLIVGY